MNITRMKKTKQLVYVVGSKDTLYSYVLFPFDKPSKKGNTGVVQVVKNSHIVTTKELVG